MGQEVKNHVLKCYPQYFADVITLRKRFEARRNDRDFKEGDTLELREYDLESKTYTGRRWHGVIGYILDTFPCGLPQYEGFCVFSIAPTATKRDKMLDAVCRTMMKGIMQLNPKHVIVQVSWDDYPLTKSEIDRVEEATGLSVVLLPGIIRGHKNVDEALRCRQRPDAIAPGAA